MTIETGADGKEFFQSRDEGGHICTIHSDLVNPLNERQLLFDKIFLRVCTKLNVPAKHTAVGRPTEKEKRYRDIASQIATKISIDKNKTGERSSESSHQSLPSCTDDELIAEELGQYSDITPIGELPKEPLQSRCVAIVLFIVLFSNIFVVINIYLCKKY